MRDQLNCTTSERPTRYSDQPTSLQTRLLGAGGVALIALLIFGGALITWTTYQAVQAPLALSVPKRASPLPRPPEDVKGITIELVVPVEFFMRTR